ncbi:MAG: hypothetical protein EP330_00990 [Deltaproteobacteria bacterium]|nr:MAG: hypothetical protein EP330_00990 [Deltaproteobacteria bacterium]
MLVLLSLTALASWPESCVLPEATAPGTREARPTVFLVAGHGTATNHGNTGVEGQREGDVTLALATDLADRLTPRFTIVQGREKDETPSYDTRLVRLTASGAPLMIGPAPTVKCCAMTRSQASRCCSTRGSPLAPSAVSSRAISPRPSLPRASFPTRRGTASSTTPTTCPACTSTAAA